MPAPDSLATPQLEPEPDDTPLYLRSEEFGARITEYCAYLNAGEYQLLRLIRQFDQEGLWKVNGVCSCAHWLNWQCGIGMNAAREKVRVANALSNLPKVSETYRKGEISYSKVRAITRIATPETEDYLLMIARHGTASHVESLVSKYRRCKRLQDQDNAVKQHALRELSYFYDDDGSFVVHGRFPAEQGAMIVKALDLAMDRAEAEARQERKYAAEKQDEDQSWITAETPAGSAESPATDERELLYYRNSAEETRPNESFEARRADALRQLAEVYLAHGPNRSSSADRYQVVVHVSAETLKKDSAGFPGDDVSAETRSSKSPDDDVSAETRTLKSPDGDVSAETAALFGSDFSYIEDGPQVSAETARRLSCDASKIDVIDDEAGEPLNIGRKARVVPPAMGRALRMRDDGCRFPGCTHKYFIDRHHIKHWADDGETAMYNLVQLCRHHHRLVHEHNFGCERTPDGKIRFTNPIGNEIGRTGALSSVPDETDPREWLRDEIGDLEITAETGVTLWRGEPIDWPLAVGHLFD